MEPAVALGTVGPDSLPDVNLPEHSHDPNDQLVGVAVRKVVATDADVDERFLQETETKLISGVRRAQ